MATIIRCDRCRGEVNNGRKIEIPIWWYEEHHEESEFDYKKVDLCKTCVESLKKWFENA